MLKICLLIITLVKFSYCEETTTAIASFIATASINVTDVSLNTTENKFNITMSRITQPSSNIETFSPFKTTPIQNNTKTFIPSPQLESFIEYNKYPVIPAFPESKQLYSQFSYIPPRTDLAQKKHGYNMGIKPNVKKEYDGPDIFITTTEKAVAQDKQLYPSSFDKPLRTDNDFPSFKYYERYNYPGPSVSSNTPSPGFSSFEWYNKFMFPSKATQIPVPDHPYPFVSDLTKKEAPSVIIPQNMGEYNKMSPWKRAAKIFAAILPIGLLISALTPTILTIGSANDTSQQCRKLAGRAESLGLDKALIEKWSQPGCEARLLCETAIKEDNLDVETVKKLFWSFVSQNAEDSETPEELESVSNAIKEKNCSKIICRQMKKKSTRDNTR